LVDISDKWTAYQFDEAVALFGMVIENAALETIETGPPNNRTTRRLYTLKKLLDPAFRLILEPEPTLDDLVSPLKRAEGVFYDEVG
jgi:hypothetical protein